MIIFGINAVLYTAETRATWAESPGDNGIYVGAAPDSLTTVTNVSDLKLTASPVKAKATIRAAAGYNLVVPVLKDVSATWKMLYDTADTNFMTFFGAFVSGAPVNCLIADSDITVSGAIGLWASFAVTKFDQDQGDEEVETVDIEITPTISAVTSYVAPQWVQSS